MSISTHILDTSVGRPAAHVPVALSVFEQDAWLLLNTAATNSDGRCSTLLPADRAFTPGIYRIHFNTRAYFDRQSIASLYPSVEVAFEVLPGEPHYHIPLLLTPHSYTTYRGS